MVSDAENYKIKPRVEMALTSEIAFQAGVAILAWRRLKDASSTTEFWSSIQSILTTSANVSKILWPPQKKRKKRGAYLRKLLQVSDASLLSSRKIRDSFEHYDERIEDWFEGGKTTSYVDLALEAQVPGLMFPPKFAHRSYDQHTYDLSFRGEDCINLRDLISELNEIREKCRPFALVHP